MDYEKEKAANQITRIKSELGNNSREMIGQMVITLMDPSTPAAVKAKTYEMIMDRLLGKPETTIRLEDSGVEMEEAERMIAAIAEDIRRNGKVD